MVTDLTVEHAIPGLSLDENHLICCRNANLALCGADLTRHPFADDPTTCHVCIDLDRTDLDCPFGGTCP